MIGLRKVSIRRAEEIDLEHVRIAFGRHLLISAPAAKARSEPVSTKHRAASSASSWSSKVTSSPRRTELSALSASGRFSRTRTAPASIGSTMRVSKVVTLALPQVRRDCHEASEGRRRSPYRHSRADRTGRRTPRPGRPWASTRRPWPPPPAPASSPSASSR